jgi:hypothetical protein
MSKLRPLLIAALRHPLPWGGIATVLFYVALDAGLATDPLVLRYLTGHWAAYACTTMFLVGIAAVVIKAIDLVVDYAALGGALFEGLPANDLPLSDVPLFQQRLDAQPARNQRSCLLRRLRAALEYLARKGTTENLEDELRSLADLDAERKHASYGIVRMMLWAMPFIGSLGTVVGIGKAVANLGPDVSVSSVAAITPGLELVFDTTALALLWSVLLMLAMFVADHVESRLLASVDVRTNRELVGRFRGQFLGQGGPSGTSAGNDGVVVEAMEKMVERQAEMFQASLDAATKHWTEQNELLKKQIESGGSGPSAGRGGGGGGASIEASHLQEVLMHTAGLAGLHQGELHGQNEIIRELAEVVRQESRNWPVRKAMRRSIDSAPAPSGNVDADWLQRG